MKVASQYLRAIMATVLPSLFLFFLLISSASAQGMQFILPTVNCGSSISSGWAFALPPQFDGQQIVSIKAFNNNSWGTNFNSSFGIGFDRGGQWTKQAGWPAKQNGSFSGIQSLAFISNNGPSFLHVPLLAPLVPQVGDIFILAYDCTPGSNPTFGWAFDYLTSAPSALPIPIFGPTLIGGDGVATGLASVRNLTDPINGGTTQIRVTFLSSSISGSACQNASIGISNAGSPNTVAAPIELLFGGAHGFNAIGRPGALIVSDPLNFSIPDGAQAVVVCDRPAGTATFSYIATPFAHSGGNTGAPGAWIGAGQSTYNQASITGGTTYNNVTYMLYSVEKIQ